MSDAHVRLRRRRTQSKPCATTFRNRHEAPVLPLPLTKKFRAFPFTLVSCNDVNEMNGAKPGEQAKK